ncbi:LysR family transcriptional regulator [Niveibacterium sp. SC-1]|uniref:LysR family transcriptional regulator n=1 Tax=Niveibacterium sp. SC-1 TaxID=3135646 RepID=UPI00311EDE78
MNAEANDLLLFARVAESGSFSRAAERVGLPKSTVSRRIAELEENLGERLLMRTTRKLSLTEFGESLLDHAQRLAEEVDAAQALAQHRQSEPSGRLRVSVPSDFASIMLPRMLADFSERHPAVNLELDLSPRRVDIVGEGFDIAIRMGKLDDDASLVARRVCEVPVGLFASPAYIAQHGEPKHPDDLAKHRCLRLLGRDGYAPHWPLYLAGKLWEGEIPESFKANSPGLLMHLALEHAGIAALVTPFTDLHVAAGRLTPVLADWHMPASTAWAVLPGRRLLPAKTRAFLEMLIAAVQPGAPMPEACKIVRDALSRQERNPGNAAETAQG